MIKIGVCFILQCTIICASWSQDGLLRIGTITGDSVENNITDVKGLGDINGDGYEDFMVMSPNNAKLYLGSPTISLTPSVIFHYPGKDSVATYLVQCEGIGDVNGDGYDDFAIRGGFSDWDFPKGKVFVYYGGKTLDTIPKYELYEPWIQDGFGYTTKMGDMNKDGYDDFAISSGYNWTDGNNRVYLFWGGDTISFDRSLTFLNVERHCFFGASVANIGDINRDGFDDIAIGAPASDSSKVYVYYGGNPIDTVMDRILRSTIKDYDFGKIIKRGGNFGGVVKFCIAGSDICLYQTLDSLIGIDGARYGFGGYVNMETGLDINNDGYNDLIIGNTNYRNSDSVMVGGAFMCFGGGMIDTMYEFKLEGENKWDEFSKTMSHADINGDGYDELLVLAPSFPDRQNSLGKVYIYAYKTVTDVREYSRNTPVNFDLLQNYPNPFNPETVISYRLAITSWVSLGVYDILGREVVMLAEGIRQPGYYSVRWNARSVSSGAYFYRLTTQHSTMQRKMVVIR